MLSFDIVSVLTVDSSVRETLLTAVGSGGSAGGAEGRSTSQRQEKEPDGGAAV